MNLYESILFDTVIKLKQQFRTQITVNDIIEEYKKKIEIVKNEYILKSITFDYDEIQKELESNILLSAFDSSSDPTKELMKLDFEESNYIPLTIEYDSSKYNPEKYLNLLKFVVLLLLKKTKKLTQEEILYKYEELVDNYKFEQEKELKQYCGIIPFDNSIW